MDFKHWHKHSNIFWVCSLCCWHCRAAQDVVDLINNCFWIVRVYLIVRVICVSWTLPGAAWVFSWICTCTEPSVMGGRGPRSALLGRGEQRKRGWYLISLVFSPEKQWDISFYARCIMYIIFQFFGVCNILKCFWKKSCSLVIYLIKNTVKTIMLWNIIANSNNCILL